MRTCLAIALLSMALMVDRAAAVEYPWCADYNFDATNCGFVSYEQCMATLMPIKGRCRPNLWATPQQDDKPKPAQPRRKHHRS